MPMKLLPLSEKISVGVPRQAQNRRSAAMNSSVLRSRQSLMCVARVLKQVKRHA